MSAWTAANGVFEGRFEPVVDEKEALDYLKKVTGKELIWPDSKDEWMYAFDHKDEYLPLGSEGSLKASYSYDISTRAYKIKVSGNLRDIWRGNKIIDWFQKVVKILRPSFARIETSTDDGSDYQKFEYKHPYSATHIKEVN